MHWIIFVTCLFLFGCQTRQEQNKSAAAVSVEIDSMQQLRQDSVLKAALRIKEKGRIDSLVAIIKLKPVWGDRATLTGDFDGDGIQDTLYEKYISQLTGKETNKDYDFAGMEKEVDWADQIGYRQKLIGEKNVASELMSRKSDIKPLMVGKTGVHDGFLYLKNVGDLNQDSSDEIVFIMDYIDFSNSNSCLLMTYKNGKWKIIHNWPITEADFIYEEGDFKPEPVYVKKMKGKVYCREMDQDWGGERWKRLKTNW